VRVGCVAKETDLVKWVEKRETRGTHHERSAPIQVASFLKQRSSCCVALVSSLCIELSRPGRNDERTRAVYRSHDDLPLVQRYAPDWNSGVGLILKPAMTPWRVDETSIKIKKVWFSLYRRWILQGTRSSFSEPQHAMLSCQRFLPQSAALHGCFSFSSASDQDAVASLLLQLISNHRVCSRVMNVDKTQGLSKAIGRSQSRWSPSPSGRVEAGQILEYPD